MSTSIQLLKAAAASSQGAAILGKILRGTAKGGAKIVKGGATLGGVAARAVGANEAIGQVIGGGAVLGGGALGVSAGARKLNNKRKMWLYQHNFGGYR